MNQLYKNIRYFILLLFVALVSACNEEGVATLVIEDGQPSVATMILGQWRPDRAERADENGNVIERPDITDMPDLNFGENGLGHFGDNGTGTGGSGSGSFDWSVDEGGNAGGGGYDEKGPSVTFNGERWYIFQLTESMLIIYRVTDTYIIIYYYYRVGDFVAGDEPKPTPAEKRIYKITETTSYESGEKRSAVHIFEYDKEGRIMSYSIDNGNYPNEFRYTYEGEEKVWANNGTEYYIGNLTDHRLEETDHRLKELFSTTATGSNQKLVMTPIYNTDGYMFLFKNMTFVYHSDNLMDNGEYLYEYTDKKNESNIDLNCIISNCSYYESQYSHYTPFAPFGFYGKFSKNLISKESFKDGNADFFCEYAYEMDSEGRVKTVVCRRVDVRNPGDILDTTTFDISYQP